MLNIDLEYNEIQYKTECTTGPVTGRVSFFKPCSGSITFTLQGKTVSPEREDMFAEQRVIHDIGLFLQALGTDLMIEAKKAGGDNADQSSV